MYCPKCSQQQVSDNVRFCSRCGFQLNVVKALLIDEDAPLTRDSETRLPARSMRARDMTIGAVLMFAFAFFITVVTSELPPNHNARFVQLVIAGLILAALINIVPLVRYFVFGGSADNEKSLSPKILSRFIAKFKKKERNAELPPAYGRPAADYATGRIKTSELAVPPSVTEDTTNLLHRN